MHPLAYHRGRLRLTQAELAAKLGIKYHSHIAGWERGEHLPTAYNVIRLADAFGLDVNTLHAELIAAKKQRSEK